MIEIVLIFVLIALLVWREWRHDVHIKDLEDRLMSHNLTEYQQVKGGNYVKPDANVIMKDNDAEVFLGDMSHFNIPKDYKIQMEGDSETPAEQRARGEK